jgi:hypothetical protein
MMYRGSFGEQSINKSLIYVFICYDVHVAMGFGAVWFCRPIPTFRRSMLSSSCGLKMETACLSETLAPTYKTTPKMKTVFLRNLGIELKINYTAPKLRTSIS